MCSGQLGTDKNVWTSKIGHVLRILCQYSYQVAALQDSHKKRKQKQIEVAHNK